MKKTNYKQLAKRLLKIIENLGSDRDNFMDFVIEEGENNPEKLALQSVNFLFNQEFISLEPLKNLCEEYPDISFLSTRKEFYTHRLNHLTDIVEKQNKENDHA